MERQEEVLIVPLSSKHIRAIWLLRHHPDVRKWSFFPPPSWEEHRWYMLDCLTREASFFVAECNGSFAGYSKANAHGVVGVAVHPSFQQLGVGTKLIRALQEKHKQLVANVHQDNKASVALFRKLGFEPLDYDEPWLYLSWRRIKLC